MALALLALPALVRYLMLLLDSRARGKNPEPPGIELFSWVGNAWSLFPVLHMLVFGYGTYLLGSSFGSAALLGSGLLLATLIPASLAVLAITRSPLESLMPRAVGGLIRRCGASYWIAPTYLLAAAVVLEWLKLLSLPDIVVEFLSFYLLFGFFTLIGSVIRPFRLDREVTIAVPMDPSDAQIDTQQTRARTDVLDHAYGFISRGNRAGGLEHVYGWLAEDPDPATAWPWFLEQMLRWENNVAALQLAQQYLSQLLHDEEDVAAVKVIMRCRLVNEAFRPLPDDIPLALAAAERCHNAELISFLR
ncbi:MAG: hypothetical protein IIA07_05275 [Proteobacteria bacterium]|nr:hypothetical protein [Pseudomonadota bacterium]